MPLSLGIGRHGWQYRDVPQSWSELLSPADEPPAKEDAHPTRAPVFVGGHYQVINEIGQGGMGRVYRVLDRISGRIVTLKRLRRARAGTDGSAGRMLLAREFELMSSLQHPNIVTVLDYGFDENDEPFLIMDLEENASNLVEAARDRPTVVQVELLVQALRALVYLHRHGVIHRDLKPENILVVGGHVHVLDFGLSIPRAILDAGGGDLGGTLDYMAPEVLTGGQSSERSDLYALGLVAYETFVGRYPFRRQEALALRHSILNTVLPRSTDHLDPRLWPIVARLLERDPDKRYSEAAEVIRDLGRAVDQEFPVETVATRESLLQAAPFIGRAPEIEQLTRVLAEARAGRGSAWLIGGESGVGKSRLLAEIRTLALVSGMTVVRGQGMSRGGGPYHVWRDAFGRLLLGVELDDMEAAVLRDIVPQIELFLGRRLQPPPPLDPESGLSRLFLTAEQVLRRQKAPLLIILEDLQWVGSESRRLWRWLVRAVEGLPVVMLASFRDDEAPDVPETMPGHGVIPLARLSKEEIASLGAAMIGQIGPNMIEFLARETEGIPFFIVEVARALAEESGELSRVEQGRLPTSVLSGGMQRLIRARLERVPAGTFRMLQTAAVIGREIDVDLIRVLHPQTPLDSWLSTCASAAVLELQDGTWRFAHDKLREQLLADLTADTFRDLSQRVAEALELTHPDRADYVNALAYHWRMAQNGAKEADYAEMAGMQALQTGAGREAVEYLRRAVALLSAGATDVSGEIGLARFPWRTAFRLDPNVHVNPESLAFRLGVLEGGLTEAYHRLGEPEGCLEHGRRALGHFGQFVPSSTSVWVFSVTRQLLIRMAQGMRRAPRSVDERQRHVAAAVGKVQAKMTDSYYYVMQPMQLVWSSVREVNQAWPAGPSRDLAQGYVMIGVLLSVTPGYRFAQRWSRLALEIAEHTCSERDLALIILRTCVVNLPSGRWDLVEAHLQRAFQLADAVGDFRLLEESAVIEAAMRIYTGRFERALQRVDLARLLASRAGDTQIQRWAVMAHGDSCVRLGRLDEAIKQYEIALSDIRGAAMQIESIWGHGMLGLARLRSGDVEGAFDAAGKSLDLMLSTQPVAYWLQHGMAATAEVFVTLAQMPEAVTLASSPTLRRRARQACAALRKYSRRFRVGKPALYLWEGTRLSVLGRHRRALRSWQRAIAAADELRMPYERARAHLEIASRGRLDHDLRQEHGRQAAAIFAEIGCRYELDLATQQAKSFDVPGLLMSSARATGENAIDPQ